MRAIVLSCGMGAGVVAVRKSAGFAMLAWDDDPLAFRIIGANYPDVMFASPKNLPPEKVPHSDMLICKGWPKEAWSVLSVFSPRVIISEGDVDAPPGYKSWSDDLEPCRFGAPLVGTRRMIVMLRDDLRFNFASFPFPDGHPCVLRSILEPGLPADGRKGYLVDVDAPCRMPRYHKGPFPLVPAEGGSRRLTRSECLRLFGFPSSYDVSMTTTSSLHAMLSESMIPTIVMALIQELRTWIDLP